MDRFFDVGWNSSFEVPDDEVAGKDSFLPIHHLLNPKLMRFRRRRRVIPWSFRLCFSSEINFSGLDEILKLDDSDSDGELTILWAFAKRVGKSSWVNVLYNLSASPKILERTEWTLPKINCRSSRKHIVYDTCPIECDRLVFENPWAS